MAQQAAERQIARISLAAERGYLPAVLAFLREATGGLGLGRTEASELERAVETVCLNVVECGFSAGEGASFDVALVRRPGQLVVVVEDQGLPYDFMSLEMSAGSGEVEATLAGLADAVRFLNQGNRGNRVEIVKDLPFAHIETYISGGGAAPPAPAGSPPVNEPVTIRPMTADDAVAVARCTYTVYGYTLPDDYLYFPERMREMLDGGLLEVYIGTTAAGEVACCLTCEVAHPGAPVGYLGEGLVDPRFRHHGLLEQLLRFAAGRAGERGMLGLYAEAVTVHPFSEKSNLAAGATEVGVQLGDEAPTVDFKGIDGAEATGRTATMLMFIRTGHGPRRVVHAPAHHRAMIERIYARGAFPRELKDAPAQAPTGSAQVRVDVFPEWSEAMLHVTAYGGDLVDLVRSRLRELCRRRIDWIGLDLPLSNPGAGWVCAGLEALGFFFAGVVPDLVGDDVLRLQYLNDVEVDVASAKLASAFGEELFGYVVRAGQAAGAVPR